MAEEVTVVNKEEEIKPSGHKLIWTTPLASVFLGLSTILLILAYALKFFDGDEAEAEDAIGILVMAPILLVILLVDFVLDAASIAISIVGTKSNIKGLKIANWVLFGVSILFLALCVTRFGILGIY